MKYHWELVFCTVVLLELRLPVICSKKNEAPWSVDVKAESGENDRIYTDQWAVHMEVDEEEAKDLAHKHGFTFLGEV